MRNAMASFVVRPILLLQLVALGGAGLAALRCREPLASVGAAVAQIVFESRALAPCEQLDELGQ